MQGMQQASFRGFPFQTFGGEFVVGRRVASHEYPFRETCWIEDMGRRGRRIGLQGFLLGDDVIAQRDTLISKCEQPGEGELKHPTLGTLQVTCVTAAMSERWDKQRVFVVNFEFLEAGKQVFVSVLDDTQSATNAATLQSRLVQAEIFVSGIGSDLRYGASVIQQAQREVQGWASQITNVVGDATGLINLVKDIPQTVQGMYGRYFNGGFAGILNPVAGATVGSLIAAGAASRQLIAQNVATLNTATANGDANGIATAAQALSDSILQAVTDPGDAIRLLSTLAGFASGSTSTSAPIGQAIADAIAKLGDLFRRCALNTLADATALYQPVSQDDAAAQRTAVCNLLYDEMTTAADQGDDTVYLALKAVRAAVSQDLSTRGAALPSMQQFSFQASMPSLVLAQRLYRDPTRAAELVTEAQPRHPAFMPLTFRGLSS